MKMIIGSIFIGIATLILVFVFNFIFHGWARAFLMNKKKIEQKGNFLFTLSVPTMAFLIILAGCYFVVNRIGLTKEFIISIVFALFANIYFFMKPSTQKAIESKLDEDLKNNIVSKEVAVIKLNVIKILIILSLLIGVPYVVYLLYKIFVYGM